MMSSLRLLSALSVGIALALLITSCGTPGVDGPPSSEGGGEGVSGTANVEDVEVLIMESFPVQVTAVARGNLPDGCTEIDSVRTDFEEDENMFTVSITTTRDEDAVCTQALVPFEERIDLEVRGLPSGTYTVDVNGVRETFTLEVDNELPESSDM